MSEQAQVIVVDDDDAVRDSLAFLFRTGGYRVHGYGSAPEALSAIDPQMRGCVVTDVRMPGMSGVDLLRELRRTAPGISVIVITGHGDVSLAVEAMKAGASDFLEKPFPDEALLSAVREALAAPGASAGADDARDRLGRLTQREREVLIHLVNGGLNKTVAYELGISVRTVEVYRANIMAKMRVDSFAELVRVSLRAGVEPN